MQDKYENKIEGETLTITITAGPAPGTYTVEFPTIENGLIFIDHVHLADGRIQPLKIRASEHPSIVAHIEARNARRAVAPTDAQLAEAEIERKMREAGLESAGNGASLYNRLNPVNGKDF